MLALGAATLLYLAVQAVGLGVLGTAPMMLGEWVFGLGMTRWFQWCSLALAAAAMWPLAR